MKKHRYHSGLKRGFFSFALVSGVMVVGTVGMHLIEGMPWMHAFYFMSMVATAQGTAQIPATNAGLVFASLMSFVSVGVVVASLGFFFGPFFGELWHIGVRKVEEEMQHFQKDKHE